MSAPELRFKEFDDTWDNAKLKDVAQVIDGDRGVNYPKSSEFKSEGFCLFLSAKNVTKSGFRFDELSFIGEERDCKLSKGKAKRHDLVLTTRGSVGHFALYEHKVPFDHIRINSGMVLLRPKEEKIKSEYLFALSNSPRMKKRIQVIAFGSAQPQLTVKEILKFPIPLPSLPEQKKIADFLGAVDEKIAGLRERERLLTDYKKGVMQKIFTQDIRFKADDGSAFPDWQIAKLGSCAKFKKGKGISKADISEEGKTKCIRYGELYTEYNEIIESIVSRTNQSIENSIISQKNDLLMPTSDVTPNGLATASALSEEGVILGGDILIMRSETILNQFFAFWVAANKKTVMRLVSGSTVFHLYGSDMEKIKLKIPHPEEQQKIADFLSAIDDKITAVSAQISHMQDFKKGLLQQMFV